MSLAQRRTAPEGINTILLEDDIWENGHESVGDETQRRGSNATQTTVLLPDGKVDLWQTISYDPFVVPPPPQHYEPVFPEDTDHLAAYEVSTAKRVGK